MVILAFCGGDGSDRRLLCRIVDSLSGQRWRSGVSIERLSSSSAPLSLILREVGVSPATISAIAIIATLNTILAQMTMAARVIYGVAREGELPAALAQVNPRTRTPMVATALVVATIVPLALLVPLASLAEGTPLATLGVFALAILSLLRLGYRCAVQNATRCRSDLRSSGRICDLHRYDDDRVSDVERFVLGLLDHSMSFVKAISTSCLLTIVLPAIAPAS